MKKNLEIQENEENKSSKKSLQPSKKLDNHFKEFLESQKIFSFRSKTKIEKERERRETEIPTFRPSILEVKTIRKKSQKIVEKSRIGNVFESLFNKSMKPQEFLATDYRIPTENMKNPLEKQVSPSSNTKKHKCSNKSKSNEKSSIKELNPTSNSSIKFKKLEKDFKSVIESFPCELNYLETSEILVRMKYLYEENDIYVRTIDERILFTKFWEIVSQRNEKVSPKSVLNFLLAIEGKVEEKSEKGVWNCSLEMQKKLAIEFEPFVKTRLYQSSLSKLQPQNQKLFKVSKENHNLASHHFERMAQDIEKITGLQVPKDITHYELIQKHEFAKEVLRNSINQQMTQKELKECTFRPSLDKENKTQMRTSFKKSDAALCLIKDEFSHETFENEKEALTLDKMKRDNDIHEFSESRRLEALFRASKKDGNLFSSKNPFVEHENTISLSKVTEKNTEEISIS